MVVLLGTHIERHYVVHHVPEFIEFARIAVVKLPDPLAPQLCRAVYTGDIVGVEVVVSLEVGRAVILDHCHIAVVLAVQIYADRTVVHRIKTDVLAELHQKLRLHHRIPDVVAAASQYQRLEVADRNSGQADEPGVGVEAHHILVRVVVAREEPQRLHLVLTVVSARHADTDFLCQERLSGLGKELDVCRTLPLAPAHEEVRELRVAVGPVGRTIREKLVAHLSLDHYAPLVVIQVVRLADYRDNHRRVAHLGHIRQDIRSGQRLADLISVRVERRHPDYVDARRVAAPSAAIGEVDSLAAVIQIRVGRGIRAVGRVVERERAVRISDIKREARLVYPGRVGERKSGTAACRAGI